MTGFVDWLQESTAGLLTLAAVSIAVLLVLIIRVKLEPFIALIVVGLLFLVAPLWAFANRVRTQGVLSLGLRRMGGLLALGGLVLCVVSGPLAVHYDRKLGDKFQKLVENEPVYYLLQ